MRKPLTPEKHAIVDYGFLAANLAVPSLIGAAPSTRALFAVFGAVQGTLNAFTDQPLSIARLVPFKVHGQVEKFSLPVFALVPLLVGVHRDRRGRWFWAASAAALLTAYNLTDWNAKNTDR